MEAPSAGSPQINESPVVKTTFFNKCCTIATYPISFLYTSASTRVTSLLSTIATKLSALHGLLLEDPPKDATKFGIFARKSYRGIMAVLDQMLKVGAIVPGIIDSLKALKQQVKSTYKSLKMFALENYVTAVDPMNHYVLFGRAFLVIHAKCLAEKSEMNKDVFSGEVARLCQLANFSFNDADRAVAEFFFEKANELWKNKQAMAENKGAELNMLIETVQKIVALELGKFDKDIDFTLYNVFQELQKAKEKITLTKFQDQCKAKLGEQWADDKRLEEIAKEYYIFIKWNIENLKDEDFVAYANDHKRLKILYRIIIQALSVMSEKYLELFEYLVDINYEPSMKEFAEKQGEDAFVKGAAFPGRIEKLEYLNKQALKIFEYYGCELKDYIASTRVFQWSNRVLHLQQAFGFLKTNALRAINLGHCVIRKFVDGMVIIYNGTTHTVSVIIDTVKDPSHLKEWVKGKFNNFVAIAKGAYLVLDFDSDGWVSPSDFKNKMLELYAFLKKYDYLGGLKLCGSSLYAKALALLPSSKRSSPAALPAQPNPEISSN